MRHWAWFGLAVMAAGCAAPQQAAPPATPAAMIATPALPQAETNVPMESLLDLRAAQLRARFGEPDATRRDGGAQVWNYEADGVCRLNLVMQSLRRAPLTVVHAQARLAGETTDQACLAALERGGTGVVAPEPPVARPVSAPARRGAARPRR